MCIWRYGAEILAKKEYIYEISKFQLIISKFISARPKNHRNLGVNTTAIWESSEEFVKCHVVILTVRFWMELIK